MFYGYTKDLCLLTSYVIGKICCGKKSCDSCEIFLATLIQEVADIKYCEKSFSKKLWALNVARIHFPKKVASNKCHEEQF